MKKIYKHLIACCLLLLMAGVVQGQPDFQETLKAAEQGNASAQFNLGVTYHYGKGVPQDYKAAVQWYRKSAEQGHADAQYNLGVMYNNGQGVPQAYKAAYAWWNIAAAQGNEKASGNRDIVAKMLSPSALSEAQALSNKYYELYVVPFE
jgi:TPR repeat protein